MGILDLLDEIWELEPDLSFGRLLHEALQPERRVAFLWELDDEQLAEALDAYRSAVEDRDRDS
jgi:hypothetical protein